MEKDLWLRNTRNISFQEIADHILAGDYIDILENPSRKGQEVFVLNIKGYVWAVPENTPSRKLSKRYGGYCETED